MQARSKNKSHYTSSLNWWVIFESLCAKKVKRENFQTTPLYLLFHVIRNVPTKSACYLPNSVYIFFNICKLVSELRYWTPQTKGGVWELPALQAIPRVRWLHCSRQTFSEERCKHKISVLKCIRRKKNNSASAVAPISLRNVF